MIASVALDRVRSAIAAPPRLSRSTVALVSAVLLLLWFNAYTIAPVSAVWRDDLEYSHGYLILVFAAWLCVLEARRAPLTPFVPSMKGLACLFALMLVTVAAAASTTLFAAAAALPALSIAAVWAAAGFKNARKFAPALAYLYFAMPLWAFFIEPLRRLTVLVVTSWIRAASMPAFIEGNLIHVPGGAFEVQGGCAGFRYALIGIALATFCNLLSRRRRLPSAALILLALVLALAGNWVRVFATVAVGTSELQNLFVVLVRDYHMLFGWVVFGLFMLPLLYVERILQFRGSGPVPARTAIGSGGAADSRLAGAYAVCALLAIGVWLNHRADSGVDASADTAFVAAPEILGWQRAGDWQDARRPQYQGTTAQSASWYADGAVRVGAYVAHYARQRPEHEVVFVANRPQGELAAVVARRSAALAAGSGLDGFQELEVTDPSGERRLVWVGLRVAGKPAASGLAAKALQIAGAIRGRRDAQALVLTAACRDDCSRARSALSRFAAAAADPLYLRAEQRIEGSPHERGALTRR